MVDQAVKDKLEAGYKKLQDSAECHSLLKKYLTRDVLDKLKDKKTGMGASLLDVVQSGKYFSKLLNPLYSNVNHDIGYENTIILTIFSLPHSHLPYPPLQNFNHKSQ